ncbi:MAG: hypothetical protein GY805_20070 [Chloroflexi bacterium]|nr:hypothetical protein [Chloroflexota bacterium]
MKSTSTNYGTLARLLHWTSAILIIVLWIMGKIMTNGEVAQLYKLHVTIGLIVLVLTVVRIVWIFMDSRPDDLTLAGWRKLAFTWNHRLILLISLLLGVSGVSILLLSGLGLSPANVAPDLIKDVPPVFVHNLGSLLMLLLFVMHVAGILHYQFKEGDTLGRMGLKLFQK